LHLAMALEGFVYPPWQGFSSIALATEYVMPGSRSDVIAAGISVHAANIIVQIRASARIIGRAPSSHLPVRRASLAF
jgi:hypothetical protein